MDLRDKRLWLDNHGTLKSEVIIYKGLRCVIMEYSIINDCQRGTTIMSIINGRQCWTKHGYDAYVVAGNIFNDVKEYLFLLCDINAPKR